MSVAAHVGDTPDAPRGSVRLLADPVFGPYVFGRLFSAAGIWVHNIVAALVVYELSSSTLAVGLVSAAQWSPQLLAPWSGSRADRGNRRTQLVLGRLITGSGSAALSIWIWQVGIDGLPGSWAMILIAFVVGIGFLVAVPAGKAVVPNLVQRNELPAAVALDALPGTVGRAAGPALGALLATSLGPATALAVAAGTQFAFAAVLMVIAIDSGERTIDTDPATRGVAASLRYLRNEPVLTLILVGIAAIGLGAEPPLTLSPALSDSLGAGDSLVGALVSSFGLGATAIFAFLGLMRRRWTPATVGNRGLRVIGIGYLIVALGPHRVVVYAGFALAGAGLSMALTGLTTALHIRVHDVYRGRIMAIWMIAVVGTRPVTSVVNGAISDALSPRWAIAFTAAAILTIAAAVRPSKLRARHQAMVEEHR